MSATPNADREQPPMLDVLIGLGANLGDRRATLDAAVDQIDTLPGVSVRRRSAWLATRPVGGPPGQDDFLNGAVRVETSLPAAELMASLAGVEQRHGRERRVRWAARTLDIDLLLYGDAVLTTPGLETPHPRMTFRRFVMAPAAEVAADMPHPRLGATIGELAERLSHGQDAAVLVGGTSAERSKVAKLAIDRRSEFRIIDSSVAGDSLGLVRREVDSVVQAPKLQVVLGGEATPLTGTPAVWIMPGDDQAAVTELAAAFDCVWPAAAAE